MYSTNLNFADSGHIERKKMLVFSLALNGYERLYASYLNSHRTYAERLDADYVAVTHPRLTLLGVECCWLKIYLIEKALDAGYETVLFIDADAYVQNTAPDIRTHFHNNKTFYLVKGYSGEFNSGVILVRKHSTSRALIKQIIDYRFVAKEQKVGWGENDSVIAATKGVGCVYELTTHWNNTFDTILNDYIRHLNHGPLRKSSKKKLFHRCLSRATKLLWWVTKLLPQKQREALIVHMTERVLSKILKRYPHFQ